ncbi:MULTISPECIES: hypothetical protein [Paraburkholderia]|uniref:Lipoprotein n=1 Tax=Paraburkholderia fungorum TaxID=134537 RepID=A0AAW3UZI0_9BURK|nr:MULTISPECIES: hypothetical protein [Paraburkholderia]KFX64499.1 hypothetical protein KBK24_0123150 [Burkholderia sp. K24]MBB4519642.1 hypothetical protein [Paraburkholderia fungorum]MBB6203538.1 hypothetical protein [Paraburkholderia fungorum]USX07294.1 hypothetical protein NHH62_32345 [Paraburkholderia fungorum]
MDDPAKLIVLVAVTVFGTACTAPQPDYTYETTVRLPDGKTARCAVNEPADAARVSSSTLDLSDQRKAEVLATQRLRVLSGPKSVYPSPYTAPVVRCVLVN